MGNELVPSLRLKKGENLNLSKDRNLKKVIFAMGWKQSKIRTQGKEEDADPDASCFLLGDTGRLISSNLKDAVVYYNNLESNGIKHSGDDRKGSTGSNDTDCESITVDFDKVHPSVQQVLFIASMYDELVADGKITADKSTINFGQVKDLYIRAYDAETGDEILRFDLTEDASGYNLMMLGKIYRRGNDWKFQAMEEPKIGTLNTLISAFV